MIGAPQIKAMTWFSKASCPISKRKEEQATNRELFDGLRSELVRTQACTSVA